MSKVHFGVSTVVIAILISVTFAEPPIPGIYGNTKVATSDNTKGVRYAGPIVYTNEKPPIISFPSPPKGGFGGGKGGKSTSLKYIPLPHHDLPVLIYQSDIAPPLHVVGVAPGPSGDKGTYGGSYKDSYGAGSEQFVQTTNYGHPSTNYGAPPKDSYGAPAKDFYGPPIDSYGSPKESYGPPKESYGSPKESYGPPKESYGPPKESYGPPKDSYGHPKESYGPPKSSSSYGPPKSSSSYGPPKSSSSYGPPKSSSYGPPKSSSSYGPPKSSSSYGPPKSSYGPPKSSSSYGSSKSSYRPTKSSYGPTKSKSSGRYKSHSSSTKSSYSPPKSKHVKGDYGFASSSAVQYTAEFVPHKSKVQSSKGPMPHIIYTGHPPIHIFQSPIYMSAPKAQKGYGTPPKFSEDGWTSASSVSSPSTTKSNDGWIPKSPSTKSKSVYQEGAGTLEDSWSHGSETYVTTVPFHGSTSSTGKKEQKGGDKGYHQGKGSSSSVKDKGHRHTSTSTTSGSSGEKKSKSQTHHSGSGKDGRRKSSHHSSQTYGKKPTSSQGNLFSDIGEMWKSVMDSAFAGSSQIASAYGYNSRPSKQHKGHSHSHSSSSSSHKSTKSTKYYPAPVQKPPIIIYQGPAPPIHVYEKQVSTGYGSFDRRIDDVDPRTRGETLTQLQETPVPLWVPNTHMPNNYQTVYVSDLTSGGSGSAGQVSQQYTPTSPVQAYVLPETEMMSASEQVNSQALLSAGGTEQHQHSGTIQTQQTGIPASTVSMMFNLA